MPTASRYKSPPGSGKGRSGRAASTIDLVEAERLAVRDFDAHHVLRLGQVDLDLARNALRVALAERRARATA